MQLKESDFTSLRGNDTYMMDRNGKVFQISTNLHPYVFQDAEDEFKYNLYSMFNPYPDALHWIKKNCTSGKVKILLDKALHLLANAVKNASSEDLEEV